VYLSALFQAVPDESVQGSLLGQVFVPIEGLLDDPCQLGRLLANRQRQQRENGSPLAFSCLHAGRFRSVKRDSFENYVRL
jgi:hypothetical protein